MDRAGVNWTLTPDQFAMAWERTDGDRVPYPLAVRLSARDSDERAAQLPELHRWCEHTLDADLEAALRLLTRPAVLVEVYGEHRRTLGPAVADDEWSVDTAEFAIGATGDAADDTAGAPAAEAKPVRVLAVAAGEVAVVAAQRPGPLPDRGGDVRLFVGNTKNLAARIVSTLPEQRPGTLGRLSSPLSRVKEDSRDLVTVPVSGPSAPARIRRLLNRPRDGIGQIVISVRRGAEMRPFGVLSWIDVAEDGRYAVRTGADVHVAPVHAEAFAAHLRPMLAAAEQATAHAERW
ncbi:ESX secretion-associated protein EspG [Nocardia puris]|uniref:ESAT-6 protein secretion system EspG family protein n=2 Tax=Nocardia puris TaxID=208602 RepID=A0A366DR67_9NOCA|nr:ESX secretion-associated protein EspG [Nocardia puris]RBO92587.1 ESAT-6 protein secretion system EspG family protein [Nocardia puris]